MTRARLAVAANCSITYLQNIEAGVLPSRRSQVMPRLIAALDRLERDEADATRPTSNAAGSSRGVADTGRSERPTDAA